MKIFEWANERQRKRERESEGESTRLRVNNPDDRLDTSLILSKEKSNAIK